MQIVDVTKAEPRMVEGVNALLRQLSGTASDLSVDRLEQIIGSECVTLLAALEAGRVVGCLTLAIFPIPTAVRARIEDLVVDTASRGRGIGESMVRHAIVMAGDRGADGIDLTSNPARKAANRLYQKIGFKVRTTNVYHYEITRPR